MSPDQTAPIEQSDLGSHCLSVRLQNILVDDKNIHFVIMRCKGEEM